MAAVRRYLVKSSLVWIAATPASSCCSKVLIRSSRCCCHWSCWVRVRLVMVGSSPSSPSKTGKQTCFPQGKSDKDRGEWRQGHGRRSRTCSLERSGNPCARGDAGPLTCVAQRVRPGCPCELG